MKSHPCRPTAGHIVVIVLVGIALIALFPYVVQLLWNGVLTDVVPVPAISYWQALGLLALSKLLFGGFPGGRGCCHHRKCREGDSDSFRSDWRRHWHGDDGQRASDEKSTQA